MVETRTRTGVEFSTLSVPISPGIGSNRSETCRVKTHFVDGFVELLPIEFIDECPVVVHDRTFEKSGMS
ncbi:hypothetical protein [Haladaptatus sp.]|uniref:hypothetical protein n=1 Tax=Haladaptatus sp. TaxID=1973141 RepID=UPI003C5BE306